MKLLIRLTEAFLFIVAWAGFVVAVPLMIVAVLGLLGFDL